MKISILGCGAYGKALMKSINKNNEIIMWSAVNNEINELPKEYKDILFTNDLNNIKKSDLIIIAIPVKYLENTLNKLKDIYDNEDILIASKGIDINSSNFAYEIVKIILNTNNVGVISGGTFAVDMGKNKVMGLTLGTNEERIKEKVIEILANKYLKIQVCNDIIGVSVCGAIKNVMAIGFGILDGANYPESSRFMYLTEAIYEIRKLIKDLGGNENTILSYAGIDDIMMTCTSSKSRNYTLGYKIGSQSNDIDEYISNTTIEGLETCKSIYNMCEHKNINLFISKIIYNILYNKEDYNELIIYLENKRTEIL